MMALHLFFATTTPHERILIGILLINNGLIILLLKPSYFAAAIRGYSCAGIGRLLRHLIKINSVFTR